MVTDVTPLAGRDAVLAATDHHPYARLTTGGVGEVRGFAGPGMTAWTGPGPWGRPVACALGDAERAARLFAQIAAAGGLDGVAHVHLPRSPRARLEPYLPIADQNDWEFRWSHRPPPPQPGEERVELLGPADEPQIADLLDRAHASSAARPGDPRVLAWYGIRAGDRLVACGGDRGRGGVGFLVGLTVDTDVQGTGLGAALTAAMTRRLFSARRSRSSAEGASDAAGDTVDCVALGVMSDNVRAIGLYTRLGFTAGMSRSSVILAR